MELSSKSQEAQLRHAQVLQELEVKRRVHTVRVPTLEKDVKAKLRELGEPITLFGEKPEDRLKRLKMIVARKEVEQEESGAVSSMVAGASSATGAHLPEVEHVQIQKKFYTPAGEGLKKARVEIATFSFDQARKRLKTARDEREDLELFRKRQEGTVGLYNTLSSLLMNASQIGDSRPLTACAFSKDDASRIIATCSWSGHARLWDRARFEAEDCKDDDMLIRSLRGHTGRVQHLDFHPQACCPTGPSEDSANLATASVDSSAMIWSLKSSKPLRTLEGHKSRLCRVKWHPQGRHVGTTSFDTTWRLWDVETGAELLLQEGHARQTYGLAFHPDGSLVASGDLGSVGHVWDLRSGKSIFMMQKHVKGILSMDWSPNGWTLATASDDHTVLIWDLRKQKCSYTLPAHSAIISVVKFAPRSGEYMLTGSYDKTCKLWNTRDWNQLAELAGHEGHIMGADISADEKHFVTASYDRTWKQWAHEDEF